MSKVLGVGENNVQVTDFYEGSVIVLYNLVEDIESDLDLTQLQDAYEKKLLVPSQSSQSSILEGIPILSLTQLTSGTGSPIHSKLTLIVNEKKSSPTLAIIISAVSFIIFSAAIYFLRLVMKPKPVQQDMPEITIKIKGKTYEEDESEFNIHRSNNDLVLESYRHADELKMKGTEIKMKAPYDHHLDTADEAQDAPQESIVTYENPYQDNNLYPTGAEMRQLNENSIESKDF